jgi:hypothetical protein
METIGVTEIDPWFVIDNKSLMNDLVYFDQLVYKLEYVEVLEKLAFAFTGSTEQIKWKLKEIEILESNGLITRYRETTENLDRETISKILEYNEKSLSLSSAFFTANKEPKTMVVDFFERFREVAQLDSRKHSVILNKKRQDNYIPIIRSSHFNKIRDQQSSTSVVSIMLNRFPTIPPTINAKKFIDFKKDPDTKLKLSRLRDWVLEINKKDYDPKEIEQKLDHLLREYTMQMETAKIKYEHTALETIVLTSLEILENITKLNFSKAAKTLFDIRKQDIALLEDERKMTGREVALIYKTKMHDFA